MQVSKASSSIRRLFASLDIHYNNIVNTKVEKQNEPDKETSNKIFSRLIGTVFFSKHQGLLNVL